MREVLWGALDLWEMIKEMAWQAGIVILIVLCCRILIGKISKQACYVLWAVVALRLLFPMMLPSDFSVFNLTSYETHWDGNKTMESYTDEALGNVVEVENTDYTSNSFTEKSEQADTDTPNGAVSENLQRNAGNLTGGQTGQNVGIDDRMQTGVVLKIFSRRYWDFILWVFGMLLMFCYGIFSYWQLKKRLRFATKAEEGVFESDTISSPFVFGMPHPVIYLPYHLEEQEKRYILCHERYHIRRKDHLVKFFAFFLLAVYWFHPLVWVAFYLMSRDMEMSCDEQVLKELNQEERKAYSRLLLRFASDRNIPMPSPVSFGENDIKCRIKQILNYKKPTFWGIIAVILLFFAVALLCLTDAGTEKPEDVVGTEDTGEDLAEKNPEELAEQLFKLENPYIGDVSADGKILSILFEQYHIAGTKGMELQTDAAPYWITIDFEKKPDETAMWKLAAVFLALVENCEELRWEYYDENQILKTSYVCTDDLNQILNCESVKDYAVSPSEIAGLLQLLENVSSEVLSNQSETSLVKESKIGWFMERAGIEWNVGQKLEQRMMADGLSYRGEMYQVRGVVYQDMDASGIMDFAVLVTDSDWENETGSYLYIYMNEDPVCVEEISESCLFLDAMEYGDIDRDGNTELVYLCNTGGNGGAGSCYKGILKYKDHTLLPMELPGDFSEDERSYGDAGYHLEVTFAEGDGVYQVNCPAIGESRLIQSVYTTYEDGIPFCDSVTGALAGGECRGYFELEIIQEDGKDYLVGKEYFFGEGGVNDGKGEASFLFDWEQENGWVVKEFEVTPYKMQRE